MRHFFFRLTPVCLCVALAFLGLFRFSAGRSGATALAGAIESGELLRLHILADSDEECAQQDKLFVRDAVLAYLSPVLEHAHNASEAEKIVLENLSGIESAAQEALRMRDREYGAQALVTTARFPDRIYLKHLVPEGEYRALQIRLGSAQGHNWWCVLYPPLCFVGEECVDLDRVHFESGILNWLRKRFARKGGSKE